MILHILRKNFICIFSILISNILCSASSITDQITIPSEELKQLIKYIDQELGQKIPTEVSPDWLDTVEQKMSFFQKALDVFTETAHKVKQYFVSAERELESVNNKLEKELGSKLGTNEFTKKIEEALEDPQKASKIQKYFYSKFAISFDLANQQQRLFADLQNLIKTSQVVAASYIQESLNQLKEKIDKAENPLQRIEQVKEWAAAGNKLFTDLQKSITIVQRNIGDGMQDINQQLQSMYNKFDEEKKLFTQDYIKGLKNLKTQLEQEQKQQI